MICRTCSWSGEPHLHARCPRCGGRYLRSEHSEPVALDPQDQLGDRLRWARVRSTVYSLAAIVAAVYFLTRS